MVGRETNIRTKKRISETGVKKNLITNSFSVFISTTEQIKVCYSNVTFRVIKPIKNLISKFFSLVDECKYCCEDKNIENIMIDTAKIILQKNIKRIDLKTQNLIWNEKQPFQTHSKYVKIRASNKQLTEIGEKKCLLKHIFNCCFYIRPSDFLKSLLRSDMSWVH